MKGKGDTVSSGGGKEGTGMGQLVLLERKNMPVNTVVSPFSSRFIPSVTGQGQGK